MVSQWLVVISLRDAEVKMKINDPEEHIKSPSVSPVNAHKMKTEDITLNVQTLKTDPTSHIWSCCIIHMAHTSPLKSIFMGQVAQPQHEYLKHTVSNLYLALSEWINILWLIYILLYVAIFLFNQILKRLFTDLLSRNLESEHGVN